MTNQQLMKTQIFAYKGFIIISAGEVTINNPDEPEQLGYVVDTKEIELTQEAYDLLITVKKCSSSLGTIMCWETSDPPYSSAFGWLGGPKALFKPNDIEADRDYNPSLLRGLITELQIPANAILVINKER